MDPMNISPMLENNTSISQAKSSGGGGVDMAVKLIEILHQLVVGGKAGGDPVAEMASKIISAGEGS
jgi:hypothetical protein